MISAAAESHRAACISGSSGEILLLTKFLHFEFDRHETSERREIVKLGAINSSKIRIRLPQGPVANLKLAT